MRTGRTDFDIITGRVQNLGFPGINCNTTDHSIYTICGVAI